MSDHGLARYWSNGPEQIGPAMREPNPGPAQVRTQYEMSEAEKQAIEKRYGCKVRREPEPAPCS